MKRPPGILINAEKDRDTDLCLHSIRKPVKNEKLCRNGEEMMDIFPRPDFERKNWMSLNGEWAFDFAPENGIDEKEWLEKGQLSMKIQVPFVYQSKASGIGDTTIHDVVWYRKNFDLPEAMEGKTILLRFGAVDYEAFVWLNGEYLGTHQGGYTPFGFDITDTVRKKENVVMVKAVDRPDVAQPRGKQYWKQQADRCWYMPSTGIWQSVWLEAVEDRPIDSIRLTPDIDMNMVRADIKVEKYLPGDMVELTFSYHGKMVKSHRTNLDGVRTTVVTALLPEDFIDECHYWTPENPNLYDVKIELWHDGRKSDTVYTYFGMRKISISDGKIMLNNSPYYMKLVLDQGYWEESILTPPNDEALKKDIEMTKKCGFNGARKHQKVEDPRYYYWADKLGLLVWGEMPSTYDFSADSMKNLTRDFLEFMDRDYNHPSIVVWVPLNESWGVRKILNDKRQVNFGEALYHLAKGYDGSRLVSTNDGWEAVRTDIIGIHDYHAEGSHFGQTYSEEKMKEPEKINAVGRRLFSEEYQYEGKSVFIVSEYGGIAMETSVNEGNWGYGKAEAGKEALLNRYRDVTSAIMKNRKICGYCYTQLTDVYQEVNGIMDMRRIPKVEPEELYKINSERQGRPE